MRRVLAAALLAATVARTAAGQAVAPAPGTKGAATPAIIHYGKWGAAALFAGFTALGMIEHRNANLAFQDLELFCRAPGACALAPDGRYAQPAAESRYQEVARGDRSARAWLISGQLALAGATTLFVIELLRQRGTRNIPFHGLTITPGRLTTRVGWQLPFTLKPIDLPSRIAQ